MKKGAFTTGLKFRTTQENLDLYLIGEFWNEDYDLVAPAVPFSPQSDIATHFLLNQPLQEAHIQ